MPYFPIIMPVFNGERYVKRAIDSVTNQSFSDFELIIIDDGSKVYSKICQLRVSNGFARIKFIAQNNKGALLARKSGIQIAKGIYTLFLDAMILYSRSIEFDFSRTRTTVDLLIFNYNKLRLRRKNKTW